MLSVSRHCDMSLPQGSTYIEEFWALAALAAASPLAGKVVDGTAVRGRLLRNLHRRLLVQLRLLLERLLQVRRVVLLRGIHLHLHLAGG